MNDQRTAEVLIRFVGPQIVENGIKVYKGTNPEVDSYSVFWDNKKLSDTSLIAQLKARGVTDVFVCGIAYDICVGKHPNCTQGGPQQGPSGFVTRTGEQL